MNRNLLHARSAFTLVEMLIVVGVLGVLISLLAPAILKSIKVAQKQARANECRMLEEAILEFWHDQNRWPIKKGDQPKKAAGYKLTYGNNNYEVFNQLIDADFGGRKKIKTYIPTERHITTATKESSYPSFAAAPLRDVLEGRNGFSRRANPVLVYWGDFKKCPHCPDSSGADAYADLNAEECMNDDCTYYKKEKKRYQFDPADRKNAIRGLRPFKVTIDLLNNSATVSDK